MTSRAYTSPCARVLCVSNVIVLHTKYYVLNGLSELYRHMDGAPRREMARRRGKLGAVHGVITNRQLFESKLAYLLLVVCESSSHKMRT